MNEDQLLTQWSQAKATARNFYQLQDPYAQTTEYRGPRMGHPSNYAYVEFRCGPSDQLVFDTATVWPQTMTHAYCIELEQAISYGIVDVLMTEGLYPYRGCCITLVQVRYDAVSSSEASFYRAAKIAMKELIEKGSWKLVPLTPRMMS
jgi:translation elongation factor EF-G